MVLRAISQDLGKRYLIKELSELPGLGHKMGQLLTLRLGRTEWQEFAPEPVPLSWVKDRIETEAPALALQISEIDPKAALASLGQVHRARLQSGDEVAIKLRYPQVDQELEEQLDLVFLAFRNVPKLISRTLDVKGYEAFLRTFFLEELDYRHEARAQERFRAAWSGVPGIVIPSVYDELSTGAILVQSFEGSTPLSEVWQLPHEKRLQCAELLSRFFVESLFRTGLVHTDLHPKNWGFRPAAGELVVYDFGATLNLDPAVLATLGALARGDHASQAQYVEAYATLGFDRDSLIELAPTLAGLTELFFAPFRVGSGFVFQDWNLQENAEKLLGDRKWIFRSAGPPWFLMVIRSFNGWLYALKELRVNFDLSTIFKVESPPVVGSERLEAPRALTRLRVQIQDNGLEVVALEFPSHTVECLEDLMPDDVLEDLKREGIDLVQIKAEAIRTGLVAQSLFEKSKGKRHYRVWLE